MSFSLEGSPLVPGYRLDNYELLCPVADGGMARVWLARKTGKHGFEKLVAIKTILPKYAADERFQRMFLDEARIASRIDHANVAHIFDLGEEHDVLYLAMEWVDGESISKLIRAVEKARKPFPLAIALRILSDVCGGLSAAHDLKDSDGTPLGVVHRDVSPQNVLVSYRGVAKLIDFGVAKARDRVSGDTSTGLFKGKVQYMAPEQALGRPVDSRADLWAVGAILYHLAAGHPPYEGENQVQTLFQLTTGRPPKPLPPSVPAEVSALVRKALAHAPEERFANAREMQQAIELAARQSGLLATAGDVGAFCQEHLGDAIEARKQAIELALKAADDRAKIQALLAVPGGESSPHGIGTSRSGTARRSSPSANLPPASEPSIPGASAAPFPFDRARSDSSTAMLGSATMDTSLPFASAPERRRTIGLALAGAGALLLVGAAAFYAGTRSSPPAPLVLTPVGASPTTPSLANDPGAPDPRPGAPGAVAPSPATPPPTKSAAPASPPSTTAPSPAPSAAVPAAAGPAFPRPTYVPRRTAVTETRPRPSAPRTSPAEAEPTSPPPPKRPVVDDGF